LAGDPPGYQKLWAEGLPPLEALRQAQLAILNAESSAGGAARGPGGASKVRPDDGVGIRVGPRLWAAWVLSGDPGDLSRIAPVALPSTDEASITPSARPTWRSVLACIVGGMLLVYLVFWCARRNRAG
jgi:hypothetical protein